MWAFKLQSPEAKYIALSQSLHDVIPVMFLLAEIQAKGFIIIYMAPYIYCEHFEDNAGALEMACLLRMHPCTKHINICYHQF